MKAPVRVVMRTSAVASTTLVVVSAGVVTVPVNGPPGGPSRATVSTAPVTGLRRRTWRKAPSTRLSSTGMVPNSSRFSGTSAMPSITRSSSDSALTG